MVLRALDPNDPQPQRDDPRFKGDYNAFRKADKAWNGREGTRRKKAKIADEAPAAETTEPVPSQLVAPLPEAVVATSVEEPSLNAKPRGRVPEVDGIPCTWDAAACCWRNHTGAMHDVAAARHERQQVFFALKAEDEAALLEQRRADCARIDAEAQRLLQQSVWSEAFGFELCLTGSMWMRDGMPTTSRRPQGPQEEWIEPTTLVSFDIAWEDQYRDRIFYKWFDAAGRPCGFSGGPCGSSAVAKGFTSTEVREGIPGHADFLAKLSALHIPRVNEKVRNLEICRSIVYWRQAYALLEADGCMSKTQFDHHIRKLMEDRVKEVTNERTREISEWKSTRRCSWDGTEY